MTQNTSSSFESYRQIAGLEADLKKSGFTNVQVFPNASVQARSSGDDIINAIAKDKNELVDTEHMNVPLDPLAPVTPNPEPPYGIAFDDPETVPFWWERGAQPVWQTVEQTIKTLDEYELWDSQFYKDFKPLRDLVGNDADQARALTQSLAAVLGFGLLTEVNTYTYRTDDVMLSTA